MSADGNWNLLLKTPMGDRKATLSLKAAGDTLTGKQGGDQGSGVCAPLAALEIS